MVGRTILACIISAVVACVLIVVFTLDLETAGAAGLVALFTYPSIVLRIVSHTSPKWSRHAFPLYVVPAVISCLFFFVPALVAPEGRDLASLLGTVLIGTFVVMLPVSGIISKQPLDNPRGK